MSGAPEPLPDATPADGSPEISVVVPVYNERGNLAPLRDELVPVLERLGESFEIIFVNDGSTDGSTETLIALRAADPRIRVLHLDRNSGQTAAMSAGFGAARGGVIVTLDGGRQNDPRDIPLLLEALEEADAVAGWRAGRADPWTRRVSSRIANAVRNWLSGDDIIDTGCSLKAFRADAVGSLKLYDGMHRFLPTLLRIEGFRVKQVQVTHRPRASGRSKYNIRNRLSRSLADLFAVRWMKRRRLEFRVREEE